MRYSFAVIGAIGIAPWVVTGCDRRPSPPADGQEETVELSGADTDVEEIDQKNMEHSIEQKGNDLFARARPFLNQDHRGFHQWTDRVTTSIRQGSDEAMNLVRRRVNSCSNL